MKITLRALFGLTALVAALLVAVPSYWPLGAWFYWGAMPVYALAVFASRAAGLKIFSYILIGAGLAVTGGIAIGHAWHYGVVGTRPEDAPWGDFVSPTIALGCMAVGLIAWPFILYRLDKRKSAPGETTTIAGK